MCRMGEKLSKKRPVSGIFETVVEKWYTGSLQVCGRRGKVKSRRKAAERGRAQGDMKIIYLSSMCSERKYKQFFAQSKNKPGQAVMKYHRLLAAGLQKQKGVSVEAISSLPITRANCKAKIVWKTMERDAGITIHYPTIFNFPGIKHFAVLLQAVIRIGKIRNRNRREPMVLICDGLIQTMSIVTLLASKIFHIKNVCILTDIPGIMVGSEKGSRAALNRIRRFDSYIFLTKQMNDYINLEKKPYIVQEGYADYSAAKQKNDITGKYDKMVYMYTGALYKIYGVKQLVDAFLKCDPQNVELHLYGDGDYVPELKRIAKKHPQIIYKGNCLIEEAVAAQRKADLLINPRFSNEEYTKYSFPSKNMEYMASGTAVLTTRLPGMPEEYLAYVYCFDNESEQGYVNTLLEMMKKSRQELAQKGTMSQEYVFEQKNNYVQGRKLLEHIRCNVLKITAS